MFVAKTLLAMLAYAVTTAVLFGNPLQPIGLATFWSDRLGIPHWQAFTVLCVAASTLFFVSPFRTMIAPVFRPMSFVILAVLLPTVTVGTYADWIRHRAVLALGADEVDEHSFFVSIHEAPREFQYFLHTAALKACTPYTWSYRELAFSVLSPDVGANVLPQPWITRCGIVQTDRRH